MTRRVVVGVMGGSTADAVTEAKAHELGRRIAEQGWVLLNGGRPSGVMAASARGAREAGGLTIGILYDDDPEQAADGLDIVIPTGMGAGRNIINILASDVVIACRGSGGTLSEIALARRFRRPLILLDFDPGTRFLELAGDGPCHHAATADEAVAIARRLLDERGRLPA